MQKESGRPEDSNSSLEACDEKLLVLLQACDAVGAHVRVQDEVQGPVGVAEPGVELDVSVDDILVPQDHAHEVERAEGLEEALCEAGHACRVEGGRGNACNPTAVDQVGSSEKVFRSDHSAVACQHVSDYEVVKVIAPGSSISDSSVRSSLFKATK